MAAIKKLARISKKWTDRVSVASPEYTEGVKNPRRDWEDESIAAKENYEAGIRTAIEQGRREKGISEAGTKKWQDQTIKKSARWTSGVVGAADEYEKGYEPYRSEIEALDYGVRYPAGDPRNLERVRVGNIALHAKKVELKSL